MNVGLIAVNSAISATSSTSGPNSGMAMNRARWDLFSKGASVCGRGAAMAPRQGHYLPERMSS